MLVKTWWSLSTDERAWGSYPELYENENNARSTELWSLGNCKS